MGTRGAIGFVVDGQEKVTYNHFDSYPDCLGESVATFCAAHPPARLTEIARAIQLVNENDAPSTEQIEACIEFSDLRVGNKRADDWYCLLRHAQGKLEPYANGLRYMSDTKSFLSDSLFCEYAYLINCDTGMLEFYKGFNKDPSAPGRYAALKRKDDPKFEYYGVRLVKEYPFAGIIEASTIVADMNVVIDAEASEEPA